MNLFNLAMYSYLKIDEHIKYGKWKLKSAW